MLDAAPQVLAALPGMTPENLQAVLTLRSDPAADPRPGPTGIPWSFAYRMKSQTIKK